MANEQFGDSTRGDDADNSRAPIDAATGRQIPELRKYWRIVVRWKWVIGGILLGALSLGLLVTLLTTRLYTADATIEISRQRDNVVNVKGVEPEVSQVDTEFYQTQYSLLRARSLARRVALDLRLVETNQFFDVFGIDPDDSGLFETVDPRRLTPAQREARLRAAIDILLDNISVSPVRGSSLVNVSFTSADPALSQRVVNAWTSGFIASSLDRRFEASAYARKFLEDRLGQLRQRLEESERRVVQYAATQRIVSVPAAIESGGLGERSLIADDLARLNAELANAVGDRIKAQSRLGTPGGLTSEALNNDAISALRQKRAEVASEYANMLAKFEPNYPNAKALASQIEALDRSLLREESRILSGTQATYGDAVGRERALRAKVAGLTGSALDLRRRSIQYNIFQREADTNRQLYDALLQRYKEIGIAGGVGTNNVLVVDSASVPEKPSRPNFPLNMLIALVLGALAAGGTVFALEQVDEAIADPSEVENAVGLTQLGTTPAIEEDPRAVLSDRKSSLTEAYLSVQTNLRFSTQHGVPKSFGVTSTRPGEGKSTTAFALAQTLSRIGRSVILVDGDMRSPSVHHMLDIPNTAGVSDYLSGETNLATLVRKLPDSGFDGMTAGPQPPNAAELLNGGRMSLLVADLLKTYDHVVVDSPPVLGLADAPLIGTHVEGMIYAVEANGARSSVIRAAIARLRAAKVNLLGVVLTKFEAKRAHYGYGYEYGYGYGQTS
ncbi:MAG: polysaccharide biosynthesis tyrosine autokinase [Pseudomonadota bacterium]